MLVRDLKSRGLTLDGDHTAFKKPHAFHLFTWRTRSHIIRSIAPPVSPEASRVLARAAQQNPLAVLTMMEVVPGRLPVCHQLGTRFTAQPLA
jgi:hypothetical protein